MSDIASTPSASTTESTSTGSESSWDNESSESEEDADLFPDVREARAAERKAAAEKKNDEPKATKEKADDKPAEPMVYMIDGLPVGYDRGVLRFSDQVEITGPGEDFSAPGDSGSLIVTGEGQAVALLFAGGRDSTGADRTYGNYITNCLQALGVTLA